MPPIFVPVLMLEHFSGWEGPIRLELINSAGRIGTFVMIVAGAGGRYLRVEYGRMVLS